MRKLTFTFILSASCLIATATTHIISVANFSFTPNQLVVLVGDTIKWQHSGGSHTTTSVTVPVGADTWNSPINSTTTTFIYVVTTPGNYTYKCTPHSSSMTGSFIAEVEVGLQDFTNRQIEFSAFFDAQRQLVIKPTIFLTAPIRLSIADLSGKVLAQQTLNPENNTDGFLRFDCATLSHGIYLVRMESNGRQGASRVLIN